MNSLILVTLAMVSYLFFCGSTALGQNQTVDTLIQDIQPDLHIGIIISDPVDGKILYQKNASHSFMPASTLKLITAFAVLTSLGENYQYRTQLFVNLKNLKSGILYDNVYCKFSGDPTLTQQDVANLFKQLAALGIHKINGKVVIDDNCSDDVCWSPGTTYDDLKFCYAAPVSGVIIDHNCVTATLIPIQHHKMTSLQFANEPHFISIKNEVRFSQNVHCNAKLVAHENNHYLVKGSITAPLKLEIAVQDYRLYIQKILTHILNINKIKVKKIIFAKYDGKSALIAEHSSKPLRELIVTMLKKSDNTIADALFKTLGYTTLHEPASWEKSSLVVKSLLQQKLNLNPEHITIIDGSGLSRYNLMTPHQLLTLLNYIYNHSNMQPILQSLPIAGVDGTLKNRMKCHMLSKVRAKTGTATGISALAGFIETDQKDVRSFVIMTNGGVAAISQYKDIEDQLCSILLNEPSATEKVN
jgi:D-alanyl-D-alanine carboxypeptidase/D-alanyl-D-alanine-endopeptidase (penicillin-binding protein 4)